MAPKNTKLVLDVEFFQGFTIDERDLTEPHNGPGYYRVVAWTDEEEGAYGTKVVKSYNGVHRFGGKKLEIPLDSPDENRYLYIELLRGISWRDPGTSNGTVVMGRAKTKLPPSTSRRKFNSKVDLVRLNSDRCVEIKGYLVISMKLRRQNTR